MAGCIGSYHPLLIIVRKYCHPSCGRKHLDLECYCSK
jgi:hypothetical protein